MSRPPALIARKPYRGFARNVPEVAARSFNGAQISRLTSDWVTAGTSADAELYRNLSRLRNRARDMERNNDYVRGFLSDLEDNVVGPDGITLQGRVLNPDGTPDKLANDRVEAGWALWGKPANCTANRSTSLWEAEKLIVRTLARDGEVFIRKLPLFDNPFRYAVQIMEGDHIDHLFNRSRLENSGNEIRMGVEIDEWGAPVAYWTFPVHPGEYYGSYSLQNRVRIPAKEMLHVFKRERPGQTRGITWFVSAMLRLRMLAAYEEAEVISARAEACKLPVIETPAIDGQQYEGDGEDADGNIIDDFDPGMTVELPYGKKVVAYNPTHPNGNYPDFRKATLRGAAKGMGASYNSLGNDLESVNFSSLRVAMLEMREGWRGTQRLLTEKFHHPLFVEWLGMAMLTGMVNLPPSKLEKFSTVEFIGRRWSWVDPAKDLDALKTALELRLTSRRRAIAEAGGDVEDVFLDNKHDEDLAKKIGITLPDPGAKLAAPDAPAAAADGAHAEPKPAAEG